MLNNKLKPIVIAVGAAFAGSLASVAYACADAEAKAQANLFAADELERSYDLVADSHGDDGSCGDGTCGDDAGGGDSGDSGDEGGDDTGGDGGDSGDSGDA